ncbi:unnamed protein product, partial [Iphiclides podalirius]
MYIINFIACFVVTVNAGPATESFKNQYCTDPRTMKKHSAYTEWADAYSCTRHRCQPGGRNLAIYTVGCKRVEPPESAIECEEVVEDTNMQFPYCCTRLRCLVVVRGEVWTRVLGQPWETLPAAPWSHMYKMKKPPPTDSTFLPKIGEGPIYELAVDTDDGAEKVLRASKATTANPDCKDSPPRANSKPDIVIALATNKDEKQSNNAEITNRRKRVKKTTTRPFSNLDVEEEAPESHNEVENDYMHTTEKPLESSDEKYFANAFAVTESAPSKQSKSRQIDWTEIPPSQWNEHEPSMDAESPPRETSVYHQADVRSDQEKKDEKPSNLQALVDAIGTRMRDIESVVQRMSQKVHRVKPDQHDFGNGVASVERRSDIQLQTRKHLNVETKEHENDGVISKGQHSNSDGENYLRSGKRMRGTTEATSEQPLFVEDTNLNGYLSDVSNNIYRRTGSPKEPIETYMAPVENRPKTMIHAIVDNSGEIEKTKKKKHTHKKKKGKSHKKHHAKDDKKKRFNRIHSSEIETNIVSLEDSSSVIAR